MIDDLRGKPVKLEWLRYETRTVKCCKIRKNNERIFYSFFFSLIFLCFISIYYYLFIKFIFYFQEGTVGMAEMVPRDLEDLRDLEVYRWLRGKFFTTVKPLVLLDAFCQKLTERGQDTLPIIPIPLHLSIFFFFSHFEKISRYTKKSLQVVLKSKWWKRPRYCLRQKSYCTVILTAIY